MAITVFLADDNPIVREGVRALLNREPDLEVVGVAADFDELLAGAEAAAPQVLVSDIRMPPTFQREGIEAAKELRKRHPGTGVVILSQYDDPEYAISLLGDGATGYGYLLKNGLAEGDQLVQAIRAEATGGTALDPAIINALVSPMTTEGEVSGTGEELLRLVAEGRPIKAIVVARHTTAEAVGEDVEKLVQGASSGGSRSLRRLRMLHQASVDSEEQGKTLSRLLPGGVAAGRWAWSLLAHGLGIPPEPVIPVLAFVAAVSAVVGVANLAAALAARRAGPVHPATALRAE